MMPTLFADGCAPTEPVTVPSEVTIAPSLYPVATTLTPEVTTFSDLIPFTPPETVNWASVLVATTVMVLATDLMSSRT